MYFVFIFSAQRGKQRFFFVPTPGPSNYNGMAVFHCVPTKGIIGPGKWLSGLMTETVLEDREGACLLPLKQTRSW